jgi:hypothetical protein
VGRWSGKRGLRTGWSAFAIVGLLNGCGAAGPEARAVDENPSRAQRLEGSTYIINVASDATVDAREPDANFGSNTRLTVDGSPERRAYVRFAVGNIEGRIRKATLKLYVTDPSVDGPAVHATSNDWNFSTLTFNNAPAPYAPAVADVGAVADNAFVEYDVTSAVQGTGTFSFVLVSEVDDGVVFLSDNGAGDAQDPQLVLETEPCPAPTVEEIAPQFDTYVSEETPTTRYEEPRKLVVDGSPRREAFLSFGVPPGWNIQGARLRMFAKDGSTNGPALYRTQPLVENGYFDWNSRPMPEGAPLVGLGSVPTGSWAEMDVSSTVTGAGEHAFALLSSSGDGVDFVASEPGLANIPRLLVNTGGPTCAYAGDGIGGTTASVHQYGARADEEPRALAAAGNGEYVVAGRFSANGSLNPADYGGGALPNGRGLALARYREDGTVVWTRGWATAEGAVPESVAVTPDGQVLVAGTYTGTVDLGTGALPVAQVGRSFFIAKFSAAGQPVWSRGFAVRNGTGPGTAGEVELAADAQGGLLLTGSFNGTLELGGTTLSSGPDTPAQADREMGLFLARFGADGAHLWSKAVPHGEGASTEATALATAPGDVVLVGGRVAAGSDLGDGTAVSRDGLFLARYSAVDGSGVWKRVLPGATGEISGLAVTGGLVAFAGQFSGTFTFADQTYSQVGHADASNATEDVFVGAVELAGPARWLRQLGSPGLERMLGLDVGLNGDIVIHGVNTWPLDFAGRKLDAHGRFVAAFSSSGQSRWARSFPGAVETVDVAVLSTGEVLVGGVLDSALPAELEGQTYTSRGWKDLVFLNIRP